MSTYYSLVFSYDRNTLKPDPAAIFYNALISAGAEFRGGIFEDSELSLDEIININSQRLIENYELGHEEKSSNDYKQAIFALGGFSGARVLIMNNDPTYGEYYFIILLNENEVMNGSSGISYKKDSIDRLLVLAKSVMKSTGALLVQTEPEICSETVSYEEYKNTRQINAYPFALSGKSSAEFADKRYYTVFPEGELAVIYDKEYNLT
ncbi:MAG: hypothetical protein IJ740_00675 [Ruminococcus sp.]|nr:hypothetical protein [Ruminococcus sp.]